jgi:predicted transcriptional regulator
MEAKAILGVRVSPAIKEQLAEVAKAQHRTSSNLVEWLIKQYLEQIAKRNAPKPDTEDDAWDKQIAADAEAGKLDFLLDAAQNEYDAGKLH